MADKLVVGCGYLGRRIAALWCAQNHRVFAMTRSTARADEWRARGLQPVLCDGVPGTPYLTAWANSGKSGRASREQALRRMAIRQARLERLALSASGHESMVKGPTAASKEQRIDFSAEIAWFGDILNYRVVVRRDWTPFGF